MKKHDIIFMAIIIMVVIVSCSGKFYQAEQEKEPCFAVITQDNILVERIDLNEVEEPREIILTGSYREIVWVEKGRIRFLEADCPDKICVRTGWLQEPGDMAVCLPNKVIIQITEH